MYCRGSSGPRAGEQREEAPKRGHGPLSRALGQVPTPQGCNDAGPASIGKTGKRIQLLL